MDKYCKEMEERHYCFQYALTMLSTDRKGILYELRLPDHWSGISLQSIFTQHWRLPKKLIHEFRMGNDVLVNGTKAVWNTELEADDIIHIPFFKPDNFGAEPSYLNIDVLYEDDHLLIANKPAGMKTHPNEAKETNTLLNGVAFHLQAQGETCMIRHVHRLDEDTSGAVLFAKHAASYAVLSRLLEEREIKRIYIAAACGILANRGGTITKPIGKDRHHPTRRRVSPAGQHAVTHYQVLETDQKHKLTLVECRLATGRTHQIRVHFAAIGHPLAGDRLYGGATIVNRQALHARKIIVPNPFTGEKISCTAPVTDGIFRFFPGYV